MTKKRKSIDFSPTYASTSKRSRSAPDKENKENYDIERPVRPQAKPKRNSHKDPHEAKENPPRKSRYTNHQNNESSETGTPKSSRSKSEHLNVRKKIMIYIFLENTVKFFQYFRI